ncbi:MAG TPA: exo-alpha-sialidase [Candidatus Thermoplasmatota archaeon]|nr:exo-alpha-sialidase [Candidatus Thermoplasmatota archaeon]
MNRAALAAVAILLLAGCLHRPAASDLFTPQSGKVHRFGGTLTFDQPVAMDGQGNVRDLPASVAGDAFPLNVEQLLPLAGAEPNIGITSAGSLFINTFDDTQKSTDHGRTWTRSYVYKTPGSPVTDDQFSTADPMLWVDPDTDRIFADQMQSLMVGFCTYLAWSDDEGATWTERPVACGLPHIDHQKMVTARYHSINGVQPPANPVYPNVLYMCTNDLDIGTWCTMSYDGGLNWAVQTQAAAPDAFCGNINGHPAAYPDGTVVLPLSAALTSDGCRRPLEVEVTEDNGLTWTSRQCAPGYGQVDVDPDITVTPDGTAYMVFRHTDQLHYLLRTTDKFLTCDVFRISPPGITLGVFQAITSGDDGKVSMVWLGTRDQQDPGATPSNATGGSRWHAYVTTSYDAASADPTFITHQVTPDEDPVQVGCVWLGGGGGGPHQCRNLLDFIDIVSDKEGRTYASITDGCVPRNGCSGDLDSVEFQSRDAQVAVLVQDHGRGLVGDSLLPPLHLLPPVPNPE